MGADGRVLQVNMSAGGVPKLPVPDAFVDRFGLAGDGHADRTTHGGPHRAVCLFAIEAIERLQAEGHPTEPGGVGENLTTAGIEWSLLPIGTRARIGDQLLLEIADTASPCATQRHNFSDGRFSRISIALHPSDARMYARVLQEGTVRPGDSIELLPVAPDSRAEIEIQLDRLDWAAGKSSLAQLRVLETLGLDVDVVDDGELIMAAVVGPAESSLNHAFGLARLPNLVSEATEFYDLQRTVGCLITEGRPWPSATPTKVMDVFAAHPAEIAEAGGPAGLRIGRITPADSNGWADVHPSAPRERSDEIYASPEFAEQLTASPHSILLIAWLDGVPVGRATMYLGHRTAWLRGGAVVPSARRQGVHRALISARARIAEEAGCDLIGTWAEAGSTSASNMAALGFRRVGIREHYRYTPATLAVPA